MSRPQRSPRPPWDRRIAILLGVGALTLYWLTAATGLFAGDSAELAAAAAGFGVPHPPGYPLYTLVTGTLVRLAPFLDPAQAANLASGLYAAVAMALLFRIARELGAGRAPAFAAIAALATGATLWSQSTVAEVYTLDLMLLALLLLALLYAPAAAGERRTWIVLGAILGLWIGHRTINVIYVPALLVFFSARARVSVLLRSAPLIAVGALMTAAVYVYLPLASLRDPAIDIGDPSSWERFRVVVLGTPYMRHLDGGTAALSIARLGRWLCDLHRELGVALPFSLLGFIAFRRRSLHRHTWALLLLILTNLAFASRYNILDIQVYFLPALVCLALFAAAGADAIHARLGGGTAASSLLVATGLGLIPFQLDQADLSGHRITRQFAIDLLASARENAVLFVNGDTTIHALWYLQGIEHRRPDVLVVSMGHLTPWHWEQLAGRCEEGALPPWSSAWSGTDSARVLRDALAERPMQLSLSVAPAALMAPGPAGARYDPLPIPRGLTMELLPFGASWHPRGSAAWSANFLLTRVDRLAPLDQTIDMDTKGTYRQYAYACFETARALDAQGQAVEARALYAAVLEFEPDRHEADVARDVLEGLGEEIPTFQIGMRARKALEK